MKHVYIMVALMLPLGLMAQPTLTSTWAPQVGDSFTMDNLNSGFTFPPSSGANQTWDYSGVSSSGQAVTSFVDPSTTPYGSNFPNANRSVSPDGSTYSYYEFNTSAWLDWGLQNASTDVTFTDPMEYMVFPITYGDNSTDVCSGTIVGGVGTRTGSSSVEGYGYGTLMLPNTTVSNVLCLKVSYTLTDNYGATSITTVNDSYLFIDPAQDYILFIVSETDAGSGAQLSGQIQSIFLGIEDEQLSDVEMVVYPNPVTTSSNASLELNAASTVDLNISVIDATGKTVVDLGNVTTTQGSNRIDLPTEELSSGLYFVQARSSDGAITKRLIIQ